MRAIIAILLTSALCLAATPPLATAADGAARTPGAAALRELPVRWDGAGRNASGQRTSSPARVPAGTSVIGLDWGGDEAALVEMRTRDEDGWSSWTEVHAEEHEGPDPHSDEAAAATTWSDPVIVSDADAVQFRSDSATLTAVAVVVEEGAEPSATYSAQAAEPTASSSSVPAPRIIRRSEWGADESLRAEDGPHYDETVRFAVVHHTAGTNDYSASESARIVRGIYEYHTRARGWDDIGYNFLVDKYGQVFEGRFGGVDAAVQGAHAAGFNSGSVGIAVLGDYRDRALGQTARTALEELLAWKFTVHHTSPTGTTTEVAGGGSRFPEGDTVQVRRIIGHRDVGYTTCPGSIRDIISNGSLATSVRNRMGQQIHTDAPDAPWASVIGDPTELTAFTTSSADWTLRIRDAGGTVVHEQTWQGQSRVTGTWDHRDDRGGWLDTGTYRATFSARLANGSALDPITIPVELGIALPEWTPLTGDWNGDGATQRAWWHGGNWVIENGNDIISFRYGRPQDAPIIGDWDADGQDEIGIIRDREWHLRYRYAGGNADRTFIYGRMTQGDVPIVGDWNADGRDDIGIIREREWHLRMSLTGGNAHRTFIYGRMTDGDIPMIGDWNGNGQDGIGIVRGDTWHLKARPSAGVADWTFNYGRMTAGDIPVTGDWDGDGTDRIGVVREQDWLLRDELSAGPATQTWGG